jgi:hypothetical protein
MTLTAIDLFCGAADSHPLVLWPELNDTWSAAA